MSLRTLAINSVEPLATQLDQVFDTIDLRLSTACPELTDICRHLRSRTHRVIGLAKLYDFGDIEANGFWTFSRLVVSFGKLCLISDVQISRTHLLSVSKVLITGLDLCDRFDSVSESEGLVTGKRDLFASKPEEFIDLLVVFKTLEPELDVIYGQYCSFWLCPSMQRVMTAFTALMAIYSGHALANWWQSSRSLWDRSLRARIVAHIAQNATVEFVRSLWNLTEYSLIRTCLPAISVRTAPKQLRDVFIPRQTKWRISSVAAEVIENETSGQTSPKANVRCRLLQSGLTTDVDRLVLHIHGGGFVAQSPDSHEVYLRDWSKKLDNIPILSVDYSLSPDSKYPQALQEVLDCYLWLTGDDPLVSQELGFRPSAGIVVCGDSAGGNLSLALSLVINDIRKLDSRVPALKGVVCFYTPFMLQTRASPSRLMTAVDTLLPLGVLLSCLEAYAPDSEPKPLKAETDVKRETFAFSSLHFLSSSVSESSTAPIDDLEDDFVHITYDDVPPDEDLAQMTPNWVNTWSNSLTKIKRKLIGWPNMTSPIAQPWYRRPTADLLAKLCRLNASTSNAYISPLLSSFESSADIPLYIVALVYDSCLDDCIEVAKRYSGPVVVDVLDGLPHGFLNFVMLSPEAKRGSDICVDRIKQALI